MIISRPCVDCRGRGFTIFASKEGLNRAVTPGEIVGLPMLRENCAECWTCAGSGRVQVRMNDPQWSKAERNLI